jgi:hypothetical protein
VVENGVTIAQHGYPRKMHQRTNAESDNDDDETSTHTD